jgi:hypothetical protein
LVNLKTKSAGDGYPKKAIEKTVLRFLGSRTFSHGLGREAASEPGIKRMICTTSFEEPQEHPYKPLSTPKSNAAVNVTAICPKI